VGRFTLNGCAAYLNSVTTRVGKALDTRVVGAPSSTPVAPGGTEVVVGVHQIGNGDGVSTWQVDQEAPVPKSATCWAF
jgi:hypothetical protein